MLRFGRHSRNSYKHLLRRFVFRQQFQSRKRGITFPLNLSQPAISYVLYFPPHWSMFILRSKKNINKSKLIYLSSSTYFFKIPYMLNFMHFDYDKYTSSISILLKIRPSLICLYLKSLQKLIYMFSQVQFARMKFRGKGYYIYRTLRNTIAPNFNYAHRVYIYAYFVSIKRLSKTSIILFGLLKTDLFTAGHSFKSTRPMNIFTGRGVRFTRQLVYKKIGKVSSYR